MCLPLLPLALAAAGTVANFIGQKQAERASTRAFSSEHDRQEALTGRQTAHFQDSLDKTAGVLDPAAEAAATEKRNSALSAAIVPQSAEGNYLPGSSSAPAVVAAAADKAGAKSEANSRSLAHALAALSANGDQMQGLNIGIGRNSQEIGQLGGFKAGSIGVLDSEMKAAAQKGAFLRGIGGLAQQIGAAWLGASALGGGAAVGGNALSGAQASALSGAI